MIYSHYKLSPISNPLNTISLKKVFYCLAWSWLEIPGSSLLMGSFSRVLYTSVTTVLSSRHPGARQGSHLTGAEAREDEQISPSVQSQEQSLTHVTLSMIPYILERQRAEMPLPFLWLFCSFLVCVWYFEGFCILYLYPSIRADPHLCNLMMKRTLRGSDNRCKSTKLQPSGTRREEAFMVNYKQLNFKVPPLIKCKSFRKMTLGRQKCCKPAPAAVDLSSARPLSCYHSLRVHFDQRENTYSNKNWSEKTKFYFFV